jgi:four helix bundle protein
MGKPSFVNLEVYRLAEQLADEVWPIVRKWDYFARDTVGKQMVRAADSIGANIAEGVGRGPYADNRNFIHVARGSLYETHHFLRRSYQRELLTASEVKSIQPIIEELSPRLNAYLQSISARANEARRRPRRSDPNH